MSFLEGRVPSVGAHERKIYMNCRNLCDSALNTIETQPESYNVFLRLKPEPTDTQIFRIVDSNTLESDIPKDSETFKGACKGRAALKRRFTFTSILDSNADQAETFSTCILPCLECFMDGESSVVMAYGTTSAGKTYTMQGFSSCPGMIPRSLHYIFKMWTNNIKTDSRHQPYRNSQLLYLNDVAYKQECTHKNRILSIDLAKYQRKCDSSYMSYKSFDTTDPFESQSYKEMEANINFPISEVSDCGTMYSIWISMFEIYNDNIMDLLVFPGDDARPNLTLGEDSQGCFYAKKAKQINVNSGHEAYQVVQFGRTNIHRGATALNERSSRSHCICTVTAVGHGAITTISRISFVDLAGAERSKKAMNEGTRLAESKSINKSLAVLGKCLNALKSKQKVIPARDSKLTTLFKNALLGGEKFTFVINISTQLHLFDETNHVLKFSALAQEIVPDRMSRSTSRFSRIIESGAFRQPSFEWSQYSSRTDLTDDERERLKLLLNEAEERFAAAVQQCDGLRQALQKQKQENKDCRSKFSEHLQRVLSAKEEDGVDYTKKLARLEEEKKDMKQKVMDLKKNLHEHKRLKLQGEEEYKALKALLFDAGEEHERLNKENEALSIEIVQLQEDKNDLLQVVESLTERMLVAEAQVEENKNGIAQYMQTIADLNREKESRLSEIENLTQAKPSAATESPEFDELKLQLEESNQQTQLLKTQLESSKCQVADLESEIENLTQAKSSAAIELRKFDELKLHLEDSNQQIQLLNTQLENSKCQIADLESEIENLTQAQSSAAIELREFNGLKLQLEERKQQVQLLNTQLENSKCQVADLQSEIENLTQAQSSAAIESREFNELKRQLEERNDQVRLLNSQLENSKYQVADLENEVATLSSSLKAQVAVVDDLQTEIKSNQALVKVLEQQAITKDDADQLKVKNSNLELEKEELLKKLKAAEYQVKILSAFKEEADDEISKLSHMRQDVDRLENEILNKDQELISFRNHRNFIFNQQESRIRALEEENARLKKDVNFGHILVGKLTDSAKKDDVTKLQIDMDSKINLLQKQLETCKKTPQRLDTPSRMRRLSRSLNNVNIIDDSNQNSMKKNFLSLENIKTGDLMQHETPIAKPQSQNKSKQYNSHTEETENEPPECPKSKRKLTAKKRDPKDHPALAKSPRGRRTGKKEKNSVASEESRLPLRSKKQLFSGDDFIDLNESDYFEPTRKLRSRRTKND